MFNKFWYLGEWVWLSYDGNKYKLLVAFPTIATFDGYSLERSKSDVVDNEQITYQGAYDIPHHFSNISYLKATQPGSNFSTSFS